MNVTTVCQNYFKEFNEAIIGTLDLVFDAPPRLFFHYPHYSISDSKISALSILKIISYFTIVIPLGFCCCLLY